MSVAESDDLRPNFCKTEWRVSREPNGKLPDRFPPNGCRHSALCFSCHGLAIVKLGSSDSPLTARSRFENLGLNGIPLPSQPA